MKLKYRFVQREVAGQWVAVAVGPDHSHFNGMVKLNATGAFVMELLMEGDRTEQELLHAMLDRYDVTEQRAKESLDRVLDALRQADLLEE